MIEDASLYYLYIVLYIMYHEKMNSFRTFCMARRTDILLPEMHYQNIDQAIYGKNMFCGLTIFVYV